MTNSVNKNGFHLASSCSNQARKGIVIMKTKVNTFRSSKLITQASALGRVKARITDSVHRLEQTLRAWRTMGNHQRAGAGSASGSYYSRLLKPKRGKTLETNKLKRNESFVAVPRKSHN